LCHGHGLLQYLLVINRRKRAAMFQQSHPYAARPLAKEVLKHVGQYDLSYHYYCRGLRPGRRGKSEAVQLADSRFPLSNVIVVFNLLKPDVGAFQAL
jgi:hypothetical protein